MIRYFFVGHDFAKVYGGLSERGQASLKETGDSQKTTESSQREASASHTEVCQPGPLSGVQNV